MSKQPEIGDPGVRLNIDHHVAQSISEYVEERRYWSDLLTERESQFRKIGYTAESADLLKGDPTITIDGLNVNIGELLASEQIDPKQWWIVDEEDGPPNTIPIVIWGTLVRDFAALTTRKPETDKLFKRVEQITDDDILQAEQEAIDVIQRALNGLKKATTPEYVVDHNFKSSDATTPGKSSVEFSSGGFVTCPTCAGKGLLRRQGGRNYAGRGG